MIKYIGSKRVLVPRIVDAVRRAVGPERLAAGATALDVFSGTSRVGHALKRAGMRVIANDSARYASVLARCYVQADAGRTTEEAQRVLDELARLPGRAGYFTRTLCEQARYVQAFNGERVDAMRDWIARAGLEPEVEAVVLTSLIEATDRVDSTAGVQMAYLKSWSRRSYNALELRLPEVLPRAHAGKGVAVELDAAAAAGWCAAEFGEVDVAYIDPPYNQHSYLGNYHVWETLARGDEPPTFGVACKREDIKQRRSAFNSRVAWRSAFEALLGRIEARALVVSMNSEGYATPWEMRDMLAAWAGGDERVLVEDVEHARYIGAKIGIYNRRGEKVGRVGTLTNTEHLFLASRRGVLRG